MRVQDIMTAGAQVMAGTGRPMWRSGGLSATAPHMQAARRGGCLVAQVAA